MSSSLSLCKADIRRHALDLGACACGFAEAAPVSTEAQMLYERWTAMRRHADMAYCAKYTDVRLDPRLLLDGAKTVICCAFNYYQSDRAGFAPSAIAKYAWGNDYHWAIKRRLCQLGDYISQQYGGAYRATVDTAPIRERYWAQRAGIGYVGLNNQLIVPGTGSYVLLGELLCTLAIEPDVPMERSCGNCGACVSACPAKAIMGDGSCDTSRCISYLTIERKGPLPDDCDTAGMIYGCDACLKVCPHNASATPTDIDDFVPDEQLLSLTPSDIFTMTSSHFRKLTRHSSISRITLDKLKSSVIKANPQT